MSSTPKPKKTTTTSEIDKILAIIDGRLSDADSEGERRVQVGVEGQGVQVEGQGGSAG